MNKNDPPFKKDDADKAISDLFFGEKSAGMGIDEAFNGLDYDSRVRLEWYSHPKNKDIVIADYSIRDGRLHKELFHPLTLCIEISFKNGDNKCRARLGAYEKAPWFDELFEQYRSETNLLLSKGELINLIQRVINSYKEEVVWLLLASYNNPIHRDYQKFPSDFKKFERFLSVAKHKINSTRTKTTSDAAEADDTTDAATENQKISVSTISVWIKAVLFIVFIRLVFSFLEFLGFLLD